MKVLEKTKVVGILGGYGPFATVEFFNFILENTPAKKDWDHLHIIVDNNPRIPSRARSFLFNEESPLPYMLEGVNRLKNAGADFFLCPCNSAHYFLQKEESRLDLPFLNMVDITIDAIEKKGIKKIGIIGSEVTVRGGVYKKKLTKKGIETVDVNDLSKVRSVIESAKQNLRKQEAKETLINIITEFKNANVEAVIFACTELSIILNSEESVLPVFDAGLLLAKETVKFAKR